MTPMEREAIARARQLAVDEKLWGRTCVTAIMGGHWDNGSIVQAHMDEAMKQVLRERKEDESEG